jgi:colanic acid/amylovoran biosynthesis glycosyltransferase
MRLAYLVNQYDTPSATFVRREAAAVEALGIEVHRVSIRQSNAKADDHDVHYLLGVQGQGRAKAASSLLWSSLRTVAQPAALAEAISLAKHLAQNAAKPWLVTAYLAEAASLLSWCRAKRIDHVHVHFGTNPTAVAMLCRALGGPTYSMTVHGPEEFDRQETLSLAKKIEHAAFVVAVSSYGRSQLWRLTPRDQWDKVVVVPCVVDPSYLAQPAPASALKRLVHVGRLHEQKGQLTLVEAAIELRQRLPDFVIDIYGDGELKQELSARIGAASLQEHVVLKGWASGEQVREALLSSRGLVLPSFAEGLPVVLMEAMACARPAISTFIAGIPELLDSSCGWVVPAGDPHALATAMHSMLTASAKTLNSLGEVGRARVMERHVPAVAAAALMAAVHRFAAR